VIKALTKKTRKNRLDRLDFRAGVLTSPKSQTTTQIIAKLVKRGSQTSRTATI